MSKFSLFRTVSHPVNGDIEEAPEIVEVEGKKYLKGEDGKPKLDDKGAPIPYEAPKEEKKEDKIDLTKVKIEDLDLETLKKTNPHVAELVEKEQKRIEEDAKKAAEDKLKEEEDLKKQNKWQELASKRETENADLRKKLEETEKQLGKYVKSVNVTLEAELAKISDDKKALIPEDYSPRQKLEYISKNAALLGVSGGGKGGPVTKGDGEPGTPKDKLIKELEDLSKKENKTAADHATALTKAKELKAILKAEEDAKT